MHDGVRGRKLWDSASSNQVSTLTTLEQRCLCVEYSKDNDAIMQEKPKSILVNSMIGSRMALCERRSR